MCAALAMAMAMASIGSVGDAKPVETFVVTTPMIEILDPTGAISRANVQRALAAIQSDLQACRSSGWTSDALAWIVVDWHGKVTRVEIAVPKPDAERCLGKALNALVVPSAQARATFVLRLRLERALSADITNGGPAPDWKPSPIPATAANLRVDLARIDVASEFPDPDRVRTIVRRHAEALRSCYALGPDHTAHVTIKLTVDANGAVIGVSATASQRDMVDCYKREVAKFSFPPPSKPSVVEIEQRPPPS